MRGGDIVCGEVKAVSAVVARVVEVRATVAVAARTACRKRWW